MKRNSTDKPPQAVQSEMEQIVDELPRKPFYEARAERLVQRLMRRLIAALRKMNHPSMLLSGQDSGLKTVWEEICVQRQGEESYEWHAYERTLCVLINGELDELSHDEEVDLWFLTQEGSDWLSEHEEDEEHPEPNDSETEDLLSNRLLSCAGDYTNRRIRAYVERHA